MSDIQVIAERVQAELERKGIRVVTSDLSRPWGGFLVIDETQADQFIEAWFPGYSKAQLMLGNKLSPKMLMAAPGKRLSWQYHFRRAEIWRVVEGPVKVVTSDTDEEKYEKIYSSGEIIVLQQGERHRLVGLEHWGVIAEIWQHTQPEAPSDENDIVRLQDDFGR